MCVIREHLNSIRELFNWIRELSSLITELSNFNIFPYCRRAGRIRELFNWIRELSYSITERYKCITVLSNCTHREFSLIELESFEIELESSAIQLERSKRGSRGMGGGPDHPEICQRWGLV